ncbi:MAG: hypothetical protein U1E53_14455 [Dongiaceae bacterium]
MFVLDLLTAHRERQVLRRQSRERLEAHQRQRFRALASAEVEHPAGLPHRQGSGRDQERRRPGGGDQRAGSGALHARILAG